MLLLFFYSIGDYRFTFSDVFRLCINSVSDVSNHFGEIMEKQMRKSSFEQFVTSLRSGLKHLWDLWLSQEKYAHFNTLPFDLTDGWEKWVLQRSLLRFFSFRYAQYAMKYYICQNEQYIHVFLFTCAWICINIFNIFTYTATEKNRSFSVFLNGLFIGSLCI